MEVVVFAVELVYKTLFKVIRKFLTQELLKEVISHFFTAFTYQSIALFITTCYRLVVYKFSDLPRRRGLKGLAW